jgi:hypothetical protein
MKWIMLVSGALVHHALCNGRTGPALAGTFGDTLGASGEIVVGTGRAHRSDGAMLIYGAFNNAAQPLV